MKWIEISVSVSREDIDPVCGIFEEIGTGGVVIDDPALIYDVVSKGNRETVAIDLSQVDIELPPVVRGYLPADGRLKKSLSELGRRLERISKSYPEAVTCREIEDGSWLNRWREHYHPFRVGEKFMVKPTWEDAVAEDGLIVIEMDPGMAFGCGTHSTTSLCMRLLEEAVTGGETVIDVGTGSGILAIAAAKLGAGPVLAVDSDPTAVRTASENAEQNGLGEIITVSEGNLLEGVHLRADIIAANIVADVIIKLLPQAISLLKENGIFIASGIISGRHDEVAGAIAGAGMLITKILREGEWSAFLAMRPQKGARQI